MKQKGLDEEGIGVGKEEQGGLGGREEDGVVVFEEAPISLSMEEEEGGGLDRSNVHCMLDY